jgi:hypothetical protein
MKLDFRHYVVILGGEYPIWEGTDKQIQDLLKQNPWAKLDVRPFPTRDEAEERRRILMHGIPLTR